MKCPKCGALIEEGRTICFMCGENLAGQAGQQGFDPNMHSNASSNIIDSTLNEKAGDIRLYRNRRADG